MVKYSAANCPSLRRFSGLVLAAILFGGAMIGPASFAAGANGVGPSKDLPRPFLNLQGFVSDSSNLQTTQSDESSEEIQEFSDSSSILPSGATDVEPMTTICHIPPGNPAAAHTIKVGSPAVQAHMAHGDHLGECNGSVLEFSSATIVSASSTTKFAGTIQIVPSSATNATLAINQAIETLDDLPDDFDIKNLGVQLSEAAKLHKLLAKEPIETKKEFQALFHEFKNKLKDHLGIGNEKSNSLPNKILQNEMDKTELQLKTKISKMIKEDQDKERISQAIELVKKRERLQEIRNEIGITKLSHGLEDRDKKLGELYQKEMKLLKDVLVSEKKHDNGKGGDHSAKELSKKEIEQIEDEVKSKSSKSQGNGGQGNNGQGNGGSNGKGNGGDSPGNSGDRGNKGGNSDKGNKGGNSKGSSGKGKGKN